MRRWWNDMRGTTALDLGVPPLPHQIASSNGGATDQGTCPEGFTHCVCSAIELELAPMSVLDRLGLQA